MQTPLNGLVDQVGRTSVVLIVNPKYQRMLSQAVMLRLAEGCPSYSSTSTLFLPSPLERCGSCCLLP